MLRTLTAAAVMALVTSTTFAPAASAEGTQVNLNVQLDPTSITNTMTAGKALKSLERQAKKACSYDVVSLKRTYTDWECVNEVVEQVVTHFNEPLLTSAYANSDMVVRVADHGDEDGALQ